jgi:ribosomal protein S27AE
VSQEPLTQLKSAVTGMLDRLKHRDCEHSRVNHSDTFCPDCGQKVLITWQFVRCKHCNARRLPRKLMDGKVKPIEKFCRRCGEAEFVTGEKAAVEVFEIVYCVAKKQVVKAHPPLPSQVTQAGHESDLVSVPNSTRRLDIMERGDTLPPPQTAEAVQTFPKSNGRTAWKQAPFFWQKPRQDVPLTSQTARVSP